MKPNIRHLLWVPSTGRIIATHTSQKKCFPPKFMKKTKSETKLARKTQDGTLIMLWVMRATHKGCHFKCMFNNVPLLPFSTYSAYLKESSWSQKKRNHKCLLFLAKTSTLLQSTVFSRRNCMQNFDEMFLLLWCQIIHSLLSLPKSKRGCRQRLGRGDVAGVPYVRLYRIQRVGT